MGQFLDTMEEKLRTGCKKVDTALLAAVSLAALLGMVVAHGFAFANLFPNHDSTVLVFDAQWTMYVLGRWAQNLYFPLIRGKVAAPWLIGGFSIVYTALTGYCIARLLQLRRGAAALLTALLGCCASVTALLATYTYETDAYLLAMLLACAGVFCLEKARPVPGFAAAAVLFCGCLALYQSYIQFALGLFLLILLREALQGTPWRAWLLHGVRAVTSVAAGGILYLVTVKISLALTGYQLADTGNGLAQLARLGPAAILAGIPAVYKNFLETLLGYSGWNDRGMRAATALLLALSVLGLVLRLRGQNRRTVVQTLLAVPLLLFSGLELPRPPRALWGWCTAALCAFLLVRMAICSNGAYVYTKLVYDQSARQMTTIMAEVQQLPGYEEGVTPVAFVGEFTDSAFAYHDPAFSRYEEGDLHQVNSAITYDGTIKWWFQHVMGSPANVVAAQAELDAWAEDPRVEAMDSYPSGEYCAMLDGTAVVKIS